MRRELEARRDLGRILDDSFALYREHWRTLLLAGAALVVPIQLGVLGIGLGWLWSDYESVRSFGETATAVVTQYVLITPLITTIAIYVAVEAGAGRKPAPGAAVTLALEAFRVLFPAMALVGLGVAVGLLAVLPGLFLAIRWAVVPQVVVIEGRRGAEALRGSWDLVRGRGWWTFVVVLVASIVAGALSAIFLVPADLLADALDAQGIELAGTILGQVATLPLVGFATTLLYFSLRAGPGPPSPARSPSGPAVGAITSEPNEIVEPVEPAPAPSDPWERRRQEGWEPPGSG